MPHHETTLVAIYHSLDAFPPTINLIEALRARGHAVTVLERGVGQPRGAAQKLGAYAVFVAGLAASLWRRRPRLLLLYDPLALLAYALVRRALPGRPATVWYHSHDVLEPHHRRGARLNRLAAWAEKRAFRWLDVFSLPADERREFFPLERFRGRYLLLPNYPSLRRYEAGYTSKSLLPPGSDVRLIFQGFAGPGRGLEPIVTHVLPWSGSGEGFRLLIKGRIDPAYRAVLEALATRHGVADRLEFLPYGPYDAVPLFTGAGHIGIAVFAGNDAMNATLGTASNKIYEYAALGLPVLAYDNPHYRRHLGQFPWVFFTDLSADSLRAAVTTALTAYDHASAAARQTFLAETNFERVFERALADGLLLAFEQYQAGEGRILRF